VDDLESRVRDLERQVEGLRSEMSRVDARSPVGGGGGGGGGLEIYIVNEVGDLPDVDPPALGFLRPNPGSNAGYKYYLRTGLKGTGRWDPWNFLDETD
jgi:hypothetical protein